MDLTGLGSIFDFGSKLIDKLFPDKTEAEKLKIQMFTLQQQGKFKELEEAMSTIRTEGSSTDPWTSRARPTFLYVMYLLILASLPYGILYTLNPIAAKIFIEGVGAWFRAIPDQLYWLFGTGYLGYTGARMYEKGKKFA